MAAEKKSMAEKLQALKDEHESTGDDQKNQLQTMLS